MSRCVTPALCANSSARVHLKTISTMRSTGSSIGPAELLQRAAVDVFHDDVVQGFVGDRVVDLADVRVLELPGERGLGEEELAVELAALRVLHRLGERDLDRDVALVERVVAE